MRFEEYVPLAMRTLNKDSSEKDMLLNACLGLVGEYAEYVEASTKAHKQEELGDIYWYVALLAEAVDFNEVEVPVPTGESILTVIGFINDTIKKNVFQGHQLMLDVMDIAISKLLRALREECEINKVTPSEIMETNVAKLMERYPQGFEVEKSVNRD